MLFIPSKDLLLFLKYLKIFPHFFGHVRKRLDKKFKVIIVIQLVIIHVMSNVLKNKVKQETKLGCQLTKYNGRNSFFLNIIQKMRQGD